MQKIYLSALIFYFYSVGFSQIPDLPSPHNMTPSVVFSTPDVVNMSSARPKNTMNISSPGTTVLQKQNEALY